MMYSRCMKPDWSILFALKPCSVEWSVARNNSTNKFNWKRVSRDSKYDSNTNKLPEPFLYRSLNWCALSYSSALLSDLGFNTKGFTIGIDGKTLFTIWNDDGSTIHPTSSQYEAIGEVKLFATALSQILLMRNGRLHLLLHITYHLQ